MADKKKLNSSEKEKLLLERIEKSKKELASLQEKRKKEIGMLAYKHGLDIVDSKTLDKEFARLAKEIVHGNA